MIKSMTGFGVAVVKQRSGNINIEIKTLNSRSFDIKFSGVSLKPELEEKIKKIISKHVLRGSVKVSIELEQDESIEDLSFNEDNFKLILDVIRKVKDTFNQELDINNLISFNNIFKSKEIQLFDNKETLKAVVEALDQLESVRADEGNQIYKDFQNRLVFIENKINDIKILSKELVNRKKDEIAEKINFFIGKGSLDENRLMQEGAYLIEKSDITEEIVRVKIHINSFLKYLELNEPVGKRLGFLAQEINREINTIGSKSPLPDVTTIIVEVKNELEKIKEQLQNIL